MRNYFPGNTFSRFMLVGWFFLWFSDSYSTFAERTESKKMKIRDHRSPQVQLDESLLFSLRMFISLTRFQTQSRQRIKIRFVFIINFCRYTHNTTEASSGSQCNCLKAKLTKNNVNVEWELQHTAVRWNEKCSGWEFNWILTSLLSNLINFNYQSIRSADLFMHKKRKKRFECCDNFLCEWDVHEARLKSQSSCEQRSTTQYDLKKNRVKWNEMRNQSKNTWNIILSAKH